MIFMANPIADILNVQILGIPVIFIFIGLGLLMFFLWKRKGKEDTFKRLNTTKEIKKDIDALIGLNNYPANFWLKTGTTNVGYVLKSVRINWSKEKSLKKNLKDNKEKTELEKIKAIITDKPKKSKEPKKAFIFKIASTNLVRRKLQKLLDKMGISLGLKYCIVDDSLLTFSDYNAVINPYCVPIRYFGMWCYSNDGMNFVETIAIKLKHQLTIDELVNTVPKQTYLEIKQAKDMEQLNALTKIKKDKEKRMLEDISKGT